jgi:hypothetical protein
MHSSPFNFHDVVSRQRAAIVNYERGQKRAATQAKRLRKEAEELTARAAAIESRSNAAQYPHFMDGVIRPVADAVLALLPGYEYEIYGPFGLCCEVSVYFTKKGLSEKDRMRGENFRALHFVSAGENDVVKLRDYSINTGKFPEGSVGSMNGMNHPEVAIPPEADAKWFLAWIRKQRANGKRSKS